MIHRIILVGLVAFAFLKLSQSDYYCGSIDSDSASGSFQMTIDSTLASYTFSIDLTNFQSICDLSSGMSLALRSNWTSSKASLSGEKCNTHNTGKDYDPTYACSSNSQHYEDECEDLERTRPQGYFYNCSYPIEDTSKATCELGDFSGKFGLIYPKYVDGMTYIENSAFDFTAPDESCYQSADAMSNMWSSIVFSCQDESAVLCASLVQSEVPCYSMSDNSTVVNDDDDYSGNFWTNYDLILLLFGGMTLCMLVVLFVLVCGSHIAKPGVNDISDEERLRLL